MIKQLLLAVFWIGTFCVNGAQDSALRAYMKRLVTKYEGQEDAFADIIDDHLIGSMVSSTQILTLYCLTNMDN